MAISANQVKELREKTGAGMMDCKNALTESSGDMEQAIVWLRKKGLASAQKKGARPPGAGKEGPRARAEEAGPQCRRRHHRPLHPPWRQAGRACRSELRNRLRRQE